MSESCSTNNSKSFSKFLGQIAKALSLSGNQGGSETDKTEGGDTKHDETAAVIDDGAFHDFGEEALEHFHHPPSIRLLRLVVFRCENHCDVKKCIFDSENVTDEGTYLTSNTKDKDNEDWKFLKETVLRFAFGEMLLKNPETVRLSRLKDDVMAFSVVFSIPTSSSSTHPSPRRPPPSSSSCGESSGSGSDSSGYSSLPILDERQRGSSGCSAGSSPGSYSSSSESHSHHNFSSTHSLPSTPSHHHHHHSSSSYCSRRGGGGGRLSLSPCVVNKVTLSTVLLFSPKVKATLLEPILRPMETFIRQAYHPKSRGKFPQTLKMYYNCLSVDVQNHGSLKRQEIPETLTLDHLLPLFNLKIFSEFVGILVTNPQAKVAVISKGGGGTQQALAIFRICYLVERFKTKFLPFFEEKDNMEAEAIPLSSFSTSGSESMNVDSGFFSCGTTMNMMLTKSTSSDSHSQRSYNYCDQEEDEDCDNKSRTSLLEEPEAEEEEEPIKEEEEPRKKGFYLGDADEDDEEQTEEKLTLSAPIKEKLYPKRGSGPSTPQKIRVREIPLDIPEATTQVPEKISSRPSISGTPSGEVYHLNSSPRFSPFYKYQLFPDNKGGGINYDYVHTITNGILEINLDKLLLRSINLEGVEPERGKKIRELTSKTRELIKLVTDAEKTMFFFLVHLMEIMNKQKI